MRELMDDTDTSRVHVRRAQAGDRGAFAELAKRHRHRLDNLIAARLRAHAIRTVDAEDVLQETLLRGFRAVRSFQWQGEESFLRWLGGIAEKVILEIARRGARNPVFQLERDVAGSGASPSKALRRGERLDRLHDALRALRPEHREVILLSRVEGLSFEEIAQRMDRSPAAVKQLLWRALKKLKDAFGDTESLHLPWRGLREGESREGPR
jgi:RNA polymerase sigma-70 factor (ECF subfamily)